MVRLGKLRSVTALSSFAIELCHAREIDMSKPEEFLQDAEFRAAFGMSMVEFKKLPRWKRDQKKKKEHGLF